MGGLSEDSYFQESINIQLDSYSRGVELSDCYSDLTIDSIDLSLQFEDWELPSESLNLLDFDE